ncbi:hypothetical protein [Candidatus Galacturonibacter soehngenii]|uniref:Uncharacterized protein n=1 Tax=Candidatus Galacturonatibacter soehngenii TaxID=2307010 RepID=A0A7V7UBQ7_9FIRM|nr:hypothetical protein [Candidatus Galacturonibacter soehngenii]KAB1437884.1 hypothetical protein F7O84_09865 [Candidatus Galacturonibacter soehngenii]
MRDIKIKGDNNGAITDYSGATIGTIINTNTDSREISVKFAKNETSIKDIIKEKIIELLIGTAFSGLSYIVKIILDKNNFNLGVTFFILFILLFFVIIAFVFIYSSVTDIIKSLFLNKQGRFTEFQSKKEAISVAYEEITSMLSSKDASYKSLKEYRNVGKLYKNIDGIIYQIKGCKCPFCESEPIGNMNFLYNKYYKRYELVCNEQSLHKLEFDFKKKI